jgi:hypothetical protein
MVVKRASGGKADWGSPYIWKPRQGTAWAYPEGKTKKRGQEEKGETGKRDAPSSPSFPTARQRTAGSQALSQALFQAETVVVAEDQKKTDQKRYQHIWEPEA